MLSLQTQMLIFMTMCIFSFTDTEIKMKDSYRYPNVCPPDILKCTYVDQGNQLFFF